MTDAVAPSLHVPSEHGDRLGDVRVANDVVAWIVAYAALEVHGVAGLYRPGSSQSIDRVLRRPLAHRGVKVQLLPDRSLKVECWIAMNAGDNAMTVGGEVQKQVAEAIDRMLGMQLASVNVYISEVVFT